MTIARKSLTLSAPAKINLHLEIRRRRPDGYHDLRMIVLPVDLCDTVHLQLQTSGIRLLCRHPQVPTDHTNLAAKAARLILEQVPEPRPGVRITLHKRIPVAAGLGGGSSDAAAVLRGLNRLLRLRFSETMLRRLGLSLGADVPLFLFGRPALAQGIGERLQPLPRLPEWTYLLVTPPFGVSTAWAYQQWQVSLTKRSSVNIIKALKNLGRLSAPRGLRNDLEPGVVREYPIIAELKQTMVSLGAVAGGMSGSGPTVVGVFESGAAAQSARRRLREQFPRCQAVIARKWRTR